jgi:hypothetical protein
MILVTCFMFRNFAPVKPTPVRGLLNSAFLHPSFKNVLRSVLSSNVFQQTPSGHRSHLIHTCRPL